MKLKVGLVVALALSLSVPGRTAPLRAAEEFVAWTRAEALMPQWGFYQVGAGEEGRAAFSQSRRRLAWVPDLPREGVYHLWVRKSVGGIEAVRLNGRPLADARGGPRGSGVGDYTWRHKGSAAAGPGPGHVDILVSAATCRLTAVLITSAEDYDPSAGALPLPAATAVIRAPRAYRDDSRLRPLAGERDFVTGTGLALYEEVFHDWVPAPGEVDRPVRMWGAANQYINGTFGIRAFADIGGMEVSLPGLAGPGGREISADGIDLRVVHVRVREISLYGWSPRMAPVAEILLRDNRTGIPPSGPQGGYGGGACVLAVPAGESRQVWMTVHVPEGYPAGVYHGRINIEAGDSGSFTLPVEIEVMPLDLRDVDGYYSPYYRFDPRPGEDHQHAIDHARYLAELKDMKRHGATTVTLYGDVETMLPLAVGSGLARAPVVIPWPSRDVAVVRGQVEAAREMGFEGLLFHGVDEPGTPDQIERARRELEWRREHGIRSHMAISAHPRASEALRDLVEYPVLNSLYHGVGNRYPDHVLHAREKGFTPISYWMTNHHFPLWFRSMTGLYNSAAGFRGAMPWAYGDHVEAIRKYDPHRVSHQVTYPDENGEPIPTLQWAAFRAGIDDVRYLQALERAIAEGRETAAGENAPGGLAEALARAEEVYGRRFGSIRLPWHRYTMRIDMETLEDSRREFAEAAAALEGLAGR